MALTAHHAMLVPTAPCSSAPEDSLEHRGQDDSLPESASAALAQGQQQSLHQQCSALFHRPASGQLSVSDVTLTGCCPPMHALTLQVICSQEIMLEGAPCRRHPAYRRPSSAPGTARSAAAGALGCPGAHAAAAQATESAAPGVHSDSR